ncbi:MAG: SDR family oxidoreductase [Fuerstiella sp.]|nr:SDR family oxidoreductase [Fuerstiella sp.]MCP4854519.1 SDR family oxidoreductase [Fuerstiella sp.]
MTTAGPHVLITGGGRGIGRHLVNGFLANGAAVGVLEYDSDLCDELQQLDGCSAWQCDVSDADDVDLALSAAFDANFVPNVLINNAGIIHSEPLVNMLSRDDRVHSRAAWKRVLAVDLDSVFFVTSRVIDYLLARRQTAVVISISSISASGNAGQSAYAAAKAGVNALTKTWARELGPLGFRFASVAPGFLDTPSTRSALSETTLDRLKQQIPLRALGDVDHIWQTVRFLIENDYVNGTVVEVDGGLVL